ncbi:hypothetical protein BATDEDRAFT_34867 [Batrachochytrium dendrobatidis JAM81]|uniref:Pentacotripeptide-repeat region of PRORP domain-containing protein n=2 Tax=Batrachochytrium dendrobatidis TaxID=109871 RepID=F4P0L4_BATDJ|nr:uncharacterized protein BATDEDRAFT_34867 [Batrachochytrium dendrobatidis JAM81]EGF81614.1 hypothetical protein BATDEDRAFT_34867 [Batrachochytrium dendrobatidis JAM81]OAJ38092.1 hypothetical protein BDEG_22054 [Batrachochytrium dendrobatidis JEL423]|eukprot:XP_006678024.1 hypothetical protein BATDEDRAFT_34867 [Batrachochytrium dendrobatidis JAM81]
MNLLKIDGLVTRLPFPVYVSFKNGLATHAKLPTRIAYSTFLKNNDNTPDTQNTKTPSDSLPKVTLHQVRKRGNSNRYNTIKLAGPISSFNPQTLLDESQVSPVSRSAQDANAYPSTSRAWTSPKMWMKSVDSVDIINRSIQQNDNADSDLAGDHTGRTHNQAIRSYSNKKKSSSSSTTISTIQKDWDVGLLTAPSTGKIDPAFSRLEAGLLPHGTTSDSNKSKLAPIKDIKNDFNDTIGDKSKNGISAWVKPEKQTASSGTIPISFMLDCIKHSPDQLPYLSSDAVWAMFNRIKQAFLIKELSIHDWHKLFARIVDMSASFNDNPDPKEFQRAIILLQEMKQCGLCPDAFVYGCMYRATRDRINMVLMIHQQAVSDLARFKRQGLVVKAHDIPADYPLSNKSIRTLLAVLLRQKRKARTHSNAIYQLYENVIDTPILMTTDTYLGFLKAFTDLEDKTMVERIHHFLATRAKMTGDLNIQAYEGIMFAHLKMKNFRAVRRQMETILEKKSIKPRSATYRLALQAYEQLQDYASIYTTDALMRRFNVPIDSEIYSILLRTALTQTDSLDRIKSLHKRINSHMKTSFETLTSKSSSVKDQTISETSSPLSYTVYEPLLEAYAAVGSWDDVQKVFNQMIKVRSIAVSRKNKEQGFPSTTAAFIEFSRPNDIWRLSKHVREETQQQRPTLASTSLSENVDGSTDTKPMLISETVTTQPNSKPLNEPSTVHNRLTSQDFRKFFPPEPSRRSLRAVVSHLATKLDAIQLKEFFLKHVLTKDRLGLYAMHRLFSQAEKIKELVALSQTQIKKVKTEMPNIPTPSQSKGSFGEGRRRRKLITEHNNKIRELKKNILWASKRINRGIPIDVGFNGPLVSVYTAMNDAWRAATDARIASVPKTSKQSGDANEVDDTSMNTAENNVLCSDLKGELLMQMEHLLTELQKIEEETVFACGFRGLRPSKKSAGASSKDENILGDDFEIEFIDDDEPPEHDAIPMTPLTESHAHISEGFLVQNQHDQKSTTQVKITNSSKSTIQGKSSDILFWENE